MDTFKNNILTALSLFFHSAIFGKLVILVRAVDWSSGDWLGFDPYSALCPLGSLCKIRRLAPWSTLGHVLPARSAITKYHELGGLQNRNLFIFSPFWKLDV